MTIDVGTGIKIIQSQGRTMALRTHTTHEYYYRMTNDIKIDFDHDFESCPFFLRDYSGQLYLCTLKYRYKLPSHSSFCYGNHVYVNECGEILSLDNVNNQLVIVLPSRKYSTYRLVKNVTDGGTGAFVVSDDHIFIGGNSKIYAYTWGYWKDFEVSVDKPVRLYFDSERNYLLSLGWHNISLIDGNDGSLMDTIRVENWTRLEAVIDRFKRYWIVHWEGYSHVCIDIYEPQNGKLIWVDRKSFPSVFFSNMCVDANFNVFVPANWYGTDKCYVWMSSSDYTHATDIAFPHVGSDFVFSTALWNKPVFIAGTTGEIPNYTPYVFIYNLYTQDFYSFVHENSELLGDPGLSKCYTWGGPTPNKDTLLSAMEVVY